MNKIISLSLIILIAGCSSEAINVETTSIDKDTTYNWRLVTSWPKNYPGLGMAPERIADLVEEMSDGQMTITCLLYTSPSPRDLSTSRMPSSA